MPRSRPPGRARSHPLTPVLALVALVVGVTVGSGALAPATAGAHADTLPGALDRGEEARVVIRSVAERQGRTNAAIGVLVPGEFAVIGCSGPASWTCSLDTDTHRPHTLVSFRAGGAGARTDVDFAVRIVAPDLDADFLIPTLQTNDDGWLEPWVYATEPYPAPVLRVGDGGALRNRPGSADAACVGPPRQPASYEAHDGTDGGRQPCPEAAPPSTTGPTTTTTRPATTTTPPPTTASPGPTSTTAAAGSSDGGTAGGPSATGAGGSDDAAADGRAAATTTLAPTDAPEAGQGADRDDATATSTTDRPGTTTSSDPSPAAETDDGDDPASGAAIVVDEADGGGGPPVGVLALGGLVLATAAGSILSGRRSGSAS